MFLLRLSLLHRVILAIALTSLLQACEREPAGVNGAEPEFPTAATIGPQVVLSTDEYLASPPYDSADAEYGERLAMQCRACHTFNEGGLQLSGPNLYRFFGNRVGGVAGYPYSPALAQADFVWTPEALDAWLARPARFLPGNRMAYPGMRNAGDRNALIAALLRLTDDTARSTDNDH